MAREFRIAKPYDPQILEVSIKLSSVQSPFGKVEEGIIDFVGWYHDYIGKATFAPFHTSRRGGRFAKNDVDDWKLPDDGQYLNPVPELAELDISGIEEKHWDEEQLEQAYGVGELDILDDEQAWESDEHVILFISEYNTSRKPVSGDLESTQFFLILKRGIVTDGVATYTRVGIGHTDLDYVLEISAEHGWKEEKMQLL